MNVTIRKACRHDCEAMMELVRELAVYEKAPNEVTVSMEHFVESGFGRYPVWWAVVAEVEYRKKIKVVGMALYYIRYSTWKGQAMYLEDIIVKEKFRGNGIGALLFDELFEEAREKGLDRICLQVLDWNKPAINFYKKYEATFDKEWVNCVVNVK